MTVAGSLSLPVNLYIKNLCSSFCYRDLILTVPKRFELITSSIIDYFFSHLLDSILFWAATQLPDISRILWFETVFLFCISLLLLYHLVSSFGDIVVRCKMLMYSTFPLNLYKLSKTLSLSLLFLKTPLIGLLFVLSVANDNEIFSWPILEMDFCLATKSSMANPGLQTRNYN